VLTCLWQLETDLRGVVKVVGFGEEAPEDLDEPGDSHSLTGRVPYCQRTNLGLRGVLVFGLCSRG
jgi:hypothetical protein